MTIKNITKYEQKYIATSKIINVTIVYQSKHYGNRHISFDLTGILEHVNNQNTYKIYVKSMYILNKITR